MVEEQAPVEQKEEEKKFTKKEVLIIVRKGLHEGIVPMLQYVAEQTDNKIDDVVVDLLGKSSDALLPKEEVEE
jgi:hypothetical protein